MPLKILFIGFANIDTVNGVRYLGGGAGCMSLNAPILNISPAILTILSNDELGLLYQKELQKRKVDYHLSPITAHSLAGVTITDPFGPSAERIWHDNGILNYISDIQLNENDLTDFDGVVLANTHPKIIQHISKQLLKSTTPLFYIPGPFISRDPQSLCIDILKQAELIFANQEEAPFIHAIYPQPNPHQAIVITKGATAVEVHFSHNIHHFDNPPVDQVVDTTGAGDAFALGFITQWFTDKNLEKAVVAGQELASLVIQQPGGLIIQKK